MKLAHATGAAQHKAAASAPRLASSSLRARPVQTRAQGSKTDQSAATDAPSTSAPSAPPPAPAAEPKVVREFYALGSKVIETNQPLAGPEDEPDFWDGERFEAFGQIVERWFLPVLLVLGIICGGIAARSYNDDATVFIQSATGPEETATFIPAEVLMPTAAAGAPSLSSQ